MARINIETSLWSDFRFQKLMIKLGDRHRAMGAMVDMWTIAQKYWLPDKRLIPQEEWDESGLPVEIIELGLAERREDGIYAKGSEEHFGWWFGVSESRRRGGEASARRPRDEKGRLLPKTSSTTQLHLDKSPAESSLIQLSSSSSSSSSCSKRKKNKKEILSAESLEVFEAFWKKYPRKENKDAAKMYYQKYIATPETEKLFSIALDNYLELCKHRKTETKFYPHFTTFIGTDKTGHPWKDHVEPSPELNKARKPIFEELTFGDITL